jgi:hypothetical protein
MLVAAAGWTGCNQQPKGRQPLTNAESAQRRFALINGEFKNSRGDKEPTVFKLDAVTGEAWRYAVINFSLPTRYGTNGVMVEEGWVPIEALRYPDSKDEGLRRLGFFPTNPAGQ